MRRSKKLRSRLTRIFHTSWRVIKAVVKAVTQVLIYGIYELTIEITWAIGSLGIALILAKLGISDVVAIALGFVITVILGIAVYRMLTRQKSKRLHRRGEIKLANWIAKTLSNKASGEWSEYQDWLHDILLARRQLLARGCPSWKAALIAYWRLGGLWVVVSLIKLRRVAIAMMKWR